MNPVAALRDPKTAQRVARLGVLSSPLASSTNTPRRNFSVTTDSGLSAPRRPGSAQVRPWTRGPGAPTTRPSPSPEAVRASPRTDDARQRMAVPSHLDSGDSAESKTRSAAAVHRRRAVVLTSIGPRGSTGDWVGGSTMTTRRLKGSASAGSPPLAPGPPPPSARDSPRPRPARPRAAHRLRIDAAHNGLLGCGIEVSEVWHGPHRVRAIDSACETGGDLLDKPQASVGIVEGEET